ncbi:MAG: DUF885 domain-containing protein [Gammaproteobacteria bacterium]|nr:DUF885 domain-containing protein [Gammaproteobacteria bacterium]
MSLVTFPRATVLGVAIAFGLQGCASAPVAPSAPTSQPVPVAAAPASLAATDATTKQRLDALYEAYFEDTLRANPILATYIGDHRYDDQLPNTIGPEYRAAARALNEKYLAAIRAIDPATLAPADRISYDIFLYEREREARGDRFPFHLLPLNQAGSLLTMMPALGSGTNAQPFATVQDYERWLGRLDGMAVWMDQAVTNMREGMKAGVVQPRPVMEKVLLQLEAMTVPRAQDSQYFAPIKSLPAGFSAVDRERLTRAYTQQIETKLLPAYTRLRNFVRDEYLPHTRKSVAWTALPDGQAWYAYYVQEHTTTTMTPDEIHELGLSEVKRILGEMDQVRQQVGFKGDLQAFFDFLENDPQFYYTRGADLLADYGAIKTRVNAAMPKLFSVFPKADYEVREVEAFRAQSAAGGSYQQPSADGSRPGVFYVNTYNLKAQPKYGMETLSLHEASPGHHFQVSIQQELVDVPRFRRFGGDYTAFVEGWALYAESLGKELGFFTDPYQWFGRLNDEQLRAMRLVVDTGLHAKGWTREQAIKFMLDNSTLAESDVVSEVERYIAWPGQALGYKVGDLRIQGLRRKAEQALGPKFDVRDFHREVLCDGAVPMDVLTAKIDRWIAARR